MLPWNQIFSDYPLPVSGDTLLLNDLPGLRRFLDQAHVRHCLVKPYQEMDSYPVVEARELLPSFETDMFEYPNLPGFALVAFNRSLDYFSEIFQYDKLHPVQTDPSGSACPLEHMVHCQNTDIMAERLPRRLHASLRKATHELDATLMDNYMRILPFLLEMDRAQVMALDSDGIYHLAGIFASFPSDIDSELKRFGIRIGKFEQGNSELYERNRMFVYQYLMELYGFPVVSERRTSSALFARKLHRMGENFLLRVMGQSDRTITTYTSDAEHKRYPRLDKIALVALESDQEEAAEIIDNKGFFLDPERRVVIMKVTYKQHRFNRANVRQDRALSVAHQEILHPLSGKPLAGLNIIKDTSNMFLRLNDIVRGEYTGRILYKRVEIVENTDTDEKRLKFLHNWLLKNQRRMIGNGEDLFNKANAVISGYLHAPQNVEIFDNLHDLYHEVSSALSYVQQARRARILEDLCRHKFRGSHIGYLKMTTEAVKLLNELQFEIVTYFPTLVDTIIDCSERLLHDNYLVRSYINTPESALSDSGREVRKNYKRMVSLLDSIKAVRKTRIAGGKMIKEPSLDEVQG